MKKPIGVRKGVDGAGEAGEMNRLAAHRLDEIALRRAQQFRVARHRLGVVEDGDVHRAGLVGERLPGAKVGAKGVERLRPQGIAHHHVAGTGGKAEAFERVGEIPAEGVEIGLRDRLGEDEAVVLIGAEGLLAAPLAAHHDETTLVANRRRRNEAEELGEQPAG